MAILILIRHAHTPTAGKRLTGTAPGVHLSDQGRAQAEGLAERLATVPLAALYSSPLERCMETAEPVARGRSLQIRSIPGLREIEYGRWTGRTIAQLTRSALWKEVQRTPSRVRFPDGETLGEAQTRMVAALEEVATAHPRGLVGVVGHGDPIRLALAHYAGVHLDLFQRLVVSPASLTVIGLGSHGPRILRVNDVGGIADLVPPKPRETGRRTPRRME